MSRGFGFWPCCPSGGCVHCERLWTQWRFTVTGLSDQDATDCTLFNGTFDVDITSDDEVFCLDVIVLGGENDEQIQVRFDFALLELRSILIEFDIFGAFGEFALYQLTGLSDRCDQVFPERYEIPFVGQTANICNGWPASITLQKI